MQKTSGGDPDRTSSADPASAAAAAGPAAPAHPVDPSGRVGSRELLVELRGVPRGRWGAELERSLRAAIRTGRLRAGARLPSTRALAADLGLSRGVVVQAYEQLAAEGYLTTRPGAAARVSDLAVRRSRRPGSGDASTRTAALSGPADPAGATTRPGSLRPDAEAATPAIGPGSVRRDAGAAGGGGIGPGSVRPDAEAAGGGAAGPGSVGRDAGAAGGGAIRPLGLARTDVDPSTGGVAGGRGSRGLAGATRSAGAGTVGRGAVAAAWAALDLRPGSPALGSLPRAEWGRAVRKALATLTDAELGYGDSRGLPRLREAIADYLGRVRGAIVDPDDLVVVNGFAQGLVVVSRLLAELGVTAVGVEDPGSAHTATQLADQGMVTVPVPVDEQGVDIDGVPPDLPGPLQAVLATPAHQFPTGAVLSPSRRRRLVEWTEQADGLVIEDDYDAEYRYDHHAVGALQGMAPDRVVLGGSVSKTLAPGLRLGWLAVPPASSPAAARHKRAIDLMAPVLEQASLAELITSGSYERHIRRSRTVYKRRRDLVVELIGQQLPEAEVLGASAGLHLVVATPWVTDEAAVEEAAARRGVQVIGLAHHRHAPGPPGFVLGYGHLSDDQLRRAVLLFATAVREDSAPE